MFVCFALLKTKFLEQNVHNSVSIHMILIALLLPKSAGINLQVVQSHYDSLFSDATIYCFFTHFSLLDVKVKAASKYVDVPVSKPCSFFCMFINGSVQYFKCLNHLIDQTCVLEKYSCVWLISMYWRKSHFCFWLGLGYQTTSGPQCTGISTWTLDSLFCLLKWKRV